MTTAQLARDARPDPARTATSGRGSRMLAYGIAAISLALTAAGFLFLLAITGRSGQFVLDANGTGGLMLGFTFSVVGAIVASRRPQNPIGWIYLAIGLSQGLNVFAWGYAGYGLIAAPGSLPMADLMVMGRRLDVGARPDAVHDHLIAALPRWPPPDATLAPRQRRGHRLAVPDDGASGCRRLADTGHRPGHRRTWERWLAGPGRGCPAEGGRRDLGGRRGRLAGIAGPSVAEDERDRAHAAQVARPCRHDRDPGRVRGLEPRSRSTARCDHRILCHSAHPCRHRHRHPSLPPLRHRPDHQPHAELRRGDGHPGGRLRRRRARARGRPPTDHGRQHGRRGGLDAHRGGPLPATPRADPARGRSPLRSGAV